MREVQSQKLKVEEEEGPRSKLGIVGIRPGSSRKGDNIVDSSAQ